LEQNFVTRLLFLVHRYLGIALSLIVVAWCVSGLVMMYVQYPEVTEIEEVRGLARLSLADCCVWPEDFSDIELDRFSVEMLGGAPAARLVSGRGEYALDLDSGSYLDGFGVEQAQRFATDTVRAHGLGDAARFVGPVDRDQWTVTGAFDAHRPLYLFSADDTRGTELYVSSATGAVVQMTTSFERIGNWAGSVVHWFYPTVIRQHVVAWSQTIIWTTVLGLFLTVVGLYIGIKQLKQRRSGRWSPYRGLALWHHYAGLVFGILTLTWLFSGLLSLNPWGVFESRSFAPDAARVRAMDMRLADAKAALSRAATAGLPEGTVRLVGEPFDGEVHLTAWSDTGERTRLDATLAARPLTTADLERAAARLRPDAAVAEQDWLHDEDAYYYSHHDERALPVYRVMFADGERAYLDATTGQLSYAVDASRRGSRWLFLALHRGDFAAVVRARPVWDVMMWVLMVGVTVGAATGAWLGAQRIARFLRRLVQLRSRVASRAPDAAR
jgi:hypothetical protein